MDTSSESDETHPLNGALLVQVFHKPFLRNSKPTMMQWLQGGIADGDIEQEGQNLEIGHFSLHGLEINADLEVL